MGEPEAVLKQATSRRTHPTTQGPKRMLLPQYQACASLGYDFSSRATDHSRELTPASRPLSAECKIRRTNDSTIVSNLKPCRN